MNKRTFNKLLNACRTKDKQRLDLVKIAGLEKKARTDMALYIVKHRGPLPVDLLTDDIDRSWLACCGYLYTTKSAKNGMTFLHTCEHSII